MSVFHLRTFGGLSLTTDGQPVRGMTDHRKTLALLAVVAASSPEGIGRERLMMLLWPESDTQHARGSLKQMLHFIRRHLDRPDVVTGTVQISANRSILSSDVAFFRDALARGDDRAAIDAYTGPFLDGVHVDGAHELERWAAEERDRFARLHAEALERLATQASAENRIGDALERWSQLQSLDPLNGRYAIALIKALDASGDVSGALRFARGHEKLLHDELGSTPDQSLVAFVGNLRSRSSGPAGGRARPDSPNSLANAAHHLVSIGTAGAKLHLDEARAYFNRALTLEPQNARGLCGLGNWYYVMGIGGYSPREESFAKGRELIFAALAADDCIAEVHCSLAKVALYFDDDFTRKRFECSASFRKFSDSQTRRSTRRGRPFSERPKRPAFGTGLATRCCPRVEMPKLSMH
jgi:DNA-binding SARP family transcriptional activator